MPHMFSINRCILKPCAKCPQAVTNQNNSVTLFRVAINQLIKAALEYLHSFYLHVGLLPSQRDVENIQNLLQVLVEETFWWVSVIACIVFTSHVFEYLKKTKTTVVRHNFRDSDQPRLKQFVATEKENVKRKDSAFYTNCLQVSMFLKLLIKIKKYNN